MLLYPALRIAETLGVISNEMAGTKDHWYDYGARFYDPALGRFHSVDPLLEKYYGTTPFAYVSNNPLRFTDPDGRDKLDRIIRRAKRQYRKAERQNPQANNNSITMWTGKNGNNYVMVNSSDGAWVRNASLKPKNPKQALFQNGGFTKDGNGGWQPRTKARNPDGRSIDMSDPKLQQGSEILNTLKKAFGDIVEDVAIDHVNPHGEIESTDSQLNSVGDSVDVPLLILRTDEGGIYRDHRRLRGAHRSNGRFVSDEYFKKKESNEEENK